MIKAAAEQDGAMVIDSQTLMLAAGNFFVTSISMGDRSRGGGRSRMASAVSQQAGGCFVVKAGEKSCGTEAEPPPPGATLAVFCNRKLAERVPIEQAAGEGPGAPTKPISTGAEAEVDALKRAHAVELAKMRAEMEAQIEAARRERGPTERGEGGSGAEEIKGGDEVVAAGPKMRARCRRRRPRPWQTWPKRTRPSWRR